MTVEPPEIPDEVLSEAGPQMNFFLSPQQKKNEKKKKNRREENERNKGKMVKEKAGENGWRHGSRVFQTSSNPLQPERSPLFIFRTWLGK